MKKAWVHILFLVAMLYQTSFSQLLKLPMLVVHYIEHRHINQHITFSDFLFMHYLGDDMNDDDNDRDRELPFKSVDSKCVHQVVAVVAKPYSTRRPVQFMNDREQFHLENEHLPQRALDSLFRPPRA
ncbi:MAG: hypothetical protein JNK79_11445 [Chitinophagaceae bacterium]|nr:hypothetical protein [Chitinophagaceae bacterium]